MKLIKCLYFLLFILFCSELYAEAAAKDEPSQEKTMQAAPSMIVWLVTDTPEGKQVFTADSDARAVQLLSDIAHEKGVQVVLPLMDLKDMAVVTVDDVASKSQVAIAQASARYNPNAILIGSVETVTKDGKHELQGSWLLAQSNLAWNYHSEGDNFEQIFKSGVVQAINSVSKHTLSEQEANASESQFALTIKDVKTIDRYVHLINYLKNLPMVAQVNVRTVGPDYIVADIVLRGRADEFTRVVGADHMLKAFDAPIDPAEADVSLNYHMVS